MRLILGPFRYKPSRGRSIREPNGSIRRRNVRASQIRRLDLSGIKERMITVTRMIAPFEKAIETVMDGRPLDFPNHAMFEFDGLPDITVPLAEKSLRELGSILQEHHRSPDFGKFGKNTFPVLLALAAAFELVDGEVSPKRVIADFVNAKIILAILERIRAIQNGMKAMRSHRGQVTQAGACEFFGLDPKSPFSKHGAQGVIDAIFEELEIHRSKLTQLTAAAA